MNAGNIIRKAVVAIELKGEGASQTGQQEATNWCREILLPGIEQRLDKYNRVAHAIRLDSVQVEMAMDEALFSEAFTENLVGRILLEIDRKAKLSAGDDGGPTLKQSGGQAVDLLLFYLRYGYLPWWSRVKTVEELCNTVQPEMANGLDKTKRVKFADVLRFDSAVNRFFSLPQPSLFHSFFVGVGQSANDVVDWLDSISHFAFLLPDEQRPLFKPRVRKYLLLARLDGRSFSLPTTLSYAIAKFLRLFGDVTPLAVQELARGHRLEKELLVQWQAAAAEGLSPKAGLTKSVLNKEETANAANETTNDEATHIDKEKAEGIYINNAGLVLLAPFLANFFYETGLASGGLLHYPYVAIAALQWMATGQDKYAEFDVVLPKVLCGIEPQENIEIVAKLPAKVKVEAEALLQAVIRHWAVLKNTSVDGLRGSFLLRSGKLSFNEQWLLQVEQRSYDMLLEQLPWSLSIIKLPWMGYLLQTDWM